jgi:hypothetical protein
MTVPGGPTPFRGSHAVAAGLVTPDRLRGPRFLRLLPDVCTAGPPADRYRVRGRDAHRAERVLRDIARTTRLVDVAWRVYRYTKLDMHGDRARIVAELTRARARRT